MNGGEPDNFENSQPAEHTEEQKQAEFERACEESVPKNNGFRANAEPSAPRGFVSSPAGGQPVREFPSESAQSNGSGCPNGLKFGSDFESSRKCCNCDAYEACRNARRNGN